MSPCHSTNIVFSDIFPFNIFIQRIFVPIYVVLIGYIDKHIIFICIPQIFKQSKHIVSCRAEPIFIFMQNVFGLKYDREYHVYWLPFAILCRLMLLMTKIFHLYYRSKNEVISELRIYWTSKIMCRFIFSCVDLLSDFNFGTYYISIERLRRVENRSVLISQKDA